MHDVTLIIATVLVSLGLVLVLWRELVGAGERRGVGRVRDVVGVLVPVAATLALLMWVWIS